MTAALRHRGRFALLNILQPCPTFNRVNTLAWYRERVQRIPASHDPYDREAAFKLAFAWGDEIPVGILYLSRRPAFEHQQPALRRGTLVAQFAGT